ncbi:type II CRISPR RNA-guided endonuclease Cas9, partial [Candidatus Thioglobus sp.]|uniref:type II CRISPR RNA-guided endonuclease Cas9 n=1 Tax=Candidatus Thioglobus sp. TaxID=2026721 RepID=UPI003D0E8E13
KEQSQLFEDLFTIKKKSSLKARLITHWDFDKQTAVKLCLVEFEPSHSNHSLKAIKKLLPFLEQGFRYDEARVKADYGYEQTEIESQDKLPAPPETSNPIVNKGLHELRRVVNAVIKQYGKPDIVRIEMARDLEMNTKRYKENEFRQRKNQKANEAATQAFRQETGKKYPSYDEKIRYRLWQEQDQRCAYSGDTIALGQVFSADCEIDHILPFKKSLDDSYMNKVLCFEKENRNKADRAPIDAWGNDEDKWNQITQAISHWDKSLKSKVSRFYMKDEQLKKRDFISSQLNDTRYISRLAQGLYTPPIRLRCKCNQRLCCEPNSPSMGL